MPLLVNTIHEEENREKGKEKACEEGKENEMREMDRYEKIEYVRKNWDINQRNIKEYEKY